MTDLGDMQKIMGSVFPCYSDKTLPHPSHVSVFLQYESLLFLLLIIFRLLGVRGPQGIRLNLQLYLMLQSWLWSEVIYATPSTVMETTRRFCVFKPNRENSKKKILICWKKRAIFTGLVLGLVLYIIKLRKLHLFTHDPCHIPQRILSSTATSSSSFFPYFFFKCH